MKNVLATFLLTCFFFTTYAQSEQFRGMDWGINLSTTKQTEKATFVTQKDNRLEYESVLGEYEARLHYTFTFDDKLMGAKYIIENHFTNYHKYFEEYDFFLDLLTEKYGTPSKKMVYTSEENQKKDNHTVKLMKDGKYSQETKWQTPGVDIRLILSGSGDAGILTIEYLSQKYFDLNKKQRRDMVLNDL